MSLFDFEDVGPMEEFIGNKIETSRKRMKLTQPDLLQNLLMILVLLPLTKHADQQNQGRC
jgi:hypothetical protein